MSDGTNEAGKTVETYHPKLPKGKPFTIVREGERITVEFKPRGGREAVLVRIEPTDTKEIA